jgi:hypothetical protein
MVSFEKEKLSDMASVEQVCYILSLEGTFATLYSPQCFATGLISEGKSWWKRWCPSLEQRGSVSHSRRPVIRFAYLLLSNNNSETCIKSESSLCIFNVVMAFHEDRRRLYQPAKLMLAEQDAVNVLVHFGVRITRVCISSSNKISIYYLPNDKDVKKKIKQKPSPWEVCELSRFKPALKTVLEVHFAPSRSVDFPY